MASSGFKYKPENDQDLPPKLKLVSVNANPMKVKGKLEVVSPLSVVPDAQDASTDIAANEPARRLKVVEGQGQGNGRPQGNLKSVPGSGFKSAHSGNHKPIITGAAGESLRGKPDDNETEFSKPHKDESASPDDDDVEDSKRGTDDSYATPPAAVAAAAGSMGAGKAGEALRGKPDDYETENENSEPDENESASPGDEDVEGSKQGTDDSYTTPPEAVAAAAGSMGAGKAGEALAGKPAANPGAAERYGDWRAGKVAKEPLGGKPLEKLASKGGSAGSVAASGGRRAANYIKKHPKGTIMGVLSLITALISIIIFIVSIPFQLIQMAKSLLTNFDVGDRIEQKASRRVIARLFQAKADAATGGAKQATGHPISDKIANMRMDRFNDLLAKDGLKLEFDNSGKLSGIRNLSTGELMKDFSDSSFLDRRKAINNLVNERIAPWRVLKRVHYTKVMKFHARVSFRFWPKEKLSNIKKLFTEKVRFGATDAELANTRPDPDPNAPNQTPQDQSAVASAGEAVEGTQATLAEYQATGDKVKAVAKGVAELNSVKTAFGVTGAIALVCTIQQMIEDAASKGYVDRAFQLMRVGNMITTQMSQLYTGEGLDIDKFGQTMAAYTGNRNSKNEIDRKGWDQSAAAKRLSGQNVDSRPTITTVDAGGNSVQTVNPTYNPDLPEGSNPDGFALQKIVDYMDTIFSFIPGASWGCSVVNSWFGWVLDGLEIAGAVITGGTSAIISVAASALKQGVFMMVIVPKVLAWAANLAITGTENAVDTFNNADAGMVLSAEDYHRSYGGRQLSDAEQGQLAEATRLEQIQIAKEKGWFYRTLDITNRTSVAANLLMKVPNTPQTAVAALTNLPKTFAMNMGAVFLGGPRPALAATTFQNPYAFQYYGFTDAELAKYPDPIAIDKYLGDEVGSTGKSRLEVLGDPSEYTPANGDDPNTGDLLHCFVNNIRSPQDLASDEICAGIGTVTSGSSVSPNAGNPGREVIQKIYDANGLGIRAGEDDFLMYRLELLYVHAVRGLECQSHNQDCFQGNGALATQDGASLKIATYNLLNGHFHPEDSARIGDCGRLSELACTDKRTNIQAQLILQNQFDILGTQETSSYVYSKLRSDLTGYDSVHPATFSDSGGGGYNTIFWNTSKLTKFTEGTAKMMSNDADNPNNGIVDSPWVGLQTLDGQKLYVISIHFPIAEKADPDLGDLRTMQKAVRLAKQNFIDAHKADGMVVVVGDFNDQPYEETSYCGLTQPGYMQNLYDLAKGLPAQPACPSKSGSQPGFSSAIDHLYITPQAGVTASNWTHMSRTDPLAALGSDHTPVFASVNFPGSAATAGTLPTGTYTLPIHTYRLGTPFGQRGSVWSLGYHTGQDFPAPRGTRLYAVADGTIQFNGAGSAYGIHTILKFADGSSVLYAHQSARASGLNDGQTVTAGQLIGYVGNTGNSYGNHLHFEYWPPGATSYRQATDPVAWLKSHGVDVPKTGNLP